MAPRPAPSLRLVRLAVGPVVRARTWSALLYLAGGSVLGAAWLALLGAGLLIGGATAVLGVGVLVLLAVLALARAAGELERHLANALLDARVPAPPPDPVAADWRAAVALLVRRSRTWRSLAWLLLRGFAGVLVLTGAVLCALTLVALLVVPFWDGYLLWNDHWRSSAGWASAWTLPVGLVGLLALLHLVAPLAAAHRRMAQLLLGPDIDDVVADLRREVERADERARLARDLHDGIGHALTLIVVQAEAARLALATRPATAEKALTDIGTTGRAALDDLDATLAVLHDDPSGRRPEPTLADLADLVERARLAGLPVSVTSFDPAGVAHPASAVAYRIAQEACTNALRHGPAAPTAISIGTHGDVLQIDVRSALSDAGDVPARTGRGLAGLAERARLLGGEFTAGPAADDTWHVAARLPR